MNIFVTSPSPWESARVLPDKHIVKMPLETCQMLAIVCSDKWGHGFGTLPRADGTPYATEKGAFRNHPCTVWANSFVMNWQWLLSHGLAMCDEYTARYGKVHTCEKTLLAAKEILPTGDPTGRSGKSPTSFVFAGGLMSLSMTKPLMSLLLTSDTLHQNLGCAIIIFVFLIVNLTGYKFYHA